MYSIKIYDLADKPKILTIRHFNHEIDCYNYACDFMYHEINKKISTFTEEEKVKLLSFGSDHAGHEIFVKNDNVYTMNILLKYDVGVIDAMIDHFLDYEYVINEKNYFETDKELGLV